EQGYGLIVQGIVAERLADAPLIQRHETDGLCIMLSGPRTKRRAMIELFGRLRQPLVLFQEPVPEGIPDAISIRQDDYGGALALARRLIGDGVRSILFLKPGLEWPAIDERERGIRAAAGRQRPRVRVATLGCGTGDFTDVQTALDAHVKSAGMPDAVMGGN